LERGRSGLQFAASVVMPRIDGAHGGDDALVPGCEWTARDISAALLLSGRFSGRRAACALPMPLTDLHALHVPPGEGAQQRAMVAHELSAALAREGHDRVFDFWQTESAAHANAPGMVAVNVLSAPRAVVSRVAENLSRARLACEVIDGLPWALARAVALAYGPGAGPPIGAVDWGFESSTFSAVAGGRPLYTRHLRSCGVRLLVEAVGQALGLAEDESLRVLETYGLPDPERRDAVRSEIQEVVAEATASRLDEVAEELKKTISYFQTQYGEETLERLCLVGDGAAVENVSAHLSGEVGLPVDLWQLPGTATVGPGNSEKHPALLAIATALSALAWTT
jgi:Tfp pilus assembly PilM family ATPase